MGRKRTKSGARVEIGEATSAKPADLVLVELPRLDEDTCASLIEGCRSGRLLELVEKWLVERRAEEEDRRKVLEQKGSALLLALGVSASVSAFGAGVLPKLIELGLPWWGLVMLAGMFLVAGGVGASAALSALRVVTISPAFVPSEATVIDATAIRHYSKPENIDADPLSYRIVRVRELLRLVREAKKGADAKAVHVEHAQWRFGAFVIAAFAAAASIVAAAGIIG